MPFWHFVVFSTPLIPVAQKLVLPSININEHVFLTILLTAWKVSRISNGLIKSYGAKSTILVIIGHISYPFDPKGLTNQNLPNPK